MESLNKELIDGLALAVQQLHTRYVAEQTLTREWSSCTRGLSCPTETCAAARARTLVDRLRDSWQHLLRDRATRNLTYNDEQFHVLERIKVSLLLNFFRQSYKIYTPKVCFIK